MRRETQNILLLLLGGALLKLAIGGEYLRYVKPVHQPWVIGGGAVMLLLGIVAVVRDLRADGAKPKTACDEGQSDGAEHAHDGAEHTHSSRSAWLLLIPVLTVLLVAPPALGADSVNRAGADGTRAQAKASLNTFPPLPNGDVLEMRLTDFQARAGWDQSGSLDGRTVALTGFVAHNKGNVYVGRMVIGCCAADGYPVTVRLSGPAAAGVEGMSDDDWIKVTGQLVPGSATEQTMYVPELTVALVQKVKQPADPYEY